MPTFMITPIDAEAKARFKQAKVKLPKKLAASRGPTCTELKQAIDGMEDFVGKYKPVKPTVGKDWQIDLRSRKKTKNGPGLFIIATELKSTTKPIEYVDIDMGDYPVVALLAVEIAKLCGPQLLEGEDIYGPHLVDGSKTGAEIAEAMEEHAKKEFGQYEDFEG